MRLIPAIDLRGGRCVRLFQGRFDAETVYADDPASVLDAYVSQGARLVHVVDLDGARDGAQANRAAIERLAARGPAALQVGGGVRSRDAFELLLQLGARRVVVGSAAVTWPDEVASWIALRGPEAVVLALDVRVGAEGLPRLTTHGWQQQTEASLWETVAWFAARGLRHVLCTDVARDGALSGPNLDLYAEAQRRFPGIEWQASGGVRDAGDLHALRATGVAAVISGRALLEGRIRPEELEPFLPDA